LNAEVVLCRCFVVNVVWSDVKDTEYVRRRLGSEERAMMGALRLESIQERRCYENLSR
jgi:hypothetical protein